MQQCYGKFDVYSQPGGNTSVQMDGWFRKEIKSLDDLKGLKMRIHSVAGEVFAKLGVNVTNIAPGELYTALDRGAIDALEWVGPGMDIKMGFHKIAPYSYAGWHEPASDMQFLISKKAFAALPPEYQAVLKSAIKTASADMFFDNFAQSAKAWAERKTAFPNIKVMTFPEPVLAAMKKATDEALNDYAAKNPFFKEVLESQRAFMKTAREWTRMSEQYFTCRNRKRSTGENEAPLKGKAPAGSEHHPGKPVVILLAAGSARDRVGLIDLQHTGFGHADDIDDVPGIPQARLPSVGGEDDAAAIFATGSVVLGPVPLQPSVQHIPGQIDLGPDSGA